MKNKKSLILGKDGQVGYEICSRLLGEGIEFRALNRNDCDLKNFFELKEHLEDIPYDILINASAYNFVDRAEAEKNEAIKINAELPKLLAEDAKKKQARLVHYSTDYVFDGKKSEPYIENDKPNPLNTYGLSKLQGEENIQSVGGDFQIFRVSWVYSLRRHNFLRTMLKLAEDRDEIKIVADQIGSPTWARTIADITLESLNAPSGLYHLSPREFTSWYGFAENIFRELQTKLKKIPRLIPIKTSEFPSNVKRPANSRLSSEKLELILGHEIPNWKSELKKSLSEFE